MKNSNENKITFTMGLPAAGKSTVIANNYAGFNVIDPDQIKKASPLYTAWLNDMNSHPTFHADSTNKAKEIFDNVTANGTGNHVVDGTGTNVEELVSKIMQANNSGFVTELVWVQITLEEAIYRNNTRERTVPVEILTSKAEYIDTAFDIASEYVDNAIIINNNKRN